MDKALLKDELKNQVKPSGDAKPSIDEVISTAVKINTANQAVVSKEAILNTAMKINLLDYTCKEYEQALINHKDVKSYDDNRYFTTKEIAALEVKIVNDVREQQNTVQSLFTDKEIELGIKNYETKKNFELTNDQREAVKHILSSKDKVIAIQGDAGTGKTTMLDCVNDIVKNKSINLDLQGLSFTGKAAYEIEQASGIESQTIARFTHSQANTSNQPTMYVVDEASMLSIKDMGALMSKIDDNARVVLIGDTKQLQSIGAGKIFSTLQDEKAISTVTMSESKRQTEQVYKESTNKLAEKITPEAFDTLDQGGKIFEVKDREQRFTDVTNKYCESHQDTILVTATNRDRQELNTTIRRKLQKDGKIGNNDVGFIIRESKNLAEEQRYFNQSYSVNDLVVVNTDLLGKAGLEGQITTVNKAGNSITIKDKNNVSYDINLSKSGGDVAVYTEKMRKFTNGDKIIFLKNDKGLELTNGQTATIKDIDKSGKAKLILENGKEKTINLVTQYKYVAHGYAITDYKSQGQTAKKVIYHADTKSVNFNQAYVSITRGKEDIAIFTDDKDKFKDKITKEQEKTTIHEFERQEAKKQETKLAKAIDKPEKTPEIKIDTPKIIYCTPLSRPILTEL